MAISRIKYLLLILLETLGVCVSAQNIDSLLVAGDSLRNSYRFEEALQSYSEALEIAIADSMDSVTHISERISCAENGKTMMLFMDSPVVEAKHKFSIKDFFLYYPLPDKSWRVTPNQLDTLSGKFAEAVYYQPSSSKIYYSSTDTLGTRNIYFTEQKDTAWSVPVILDKVSVSDSDDIYPMLSADGKELYFSSKGLYGVGGYDIYVSKWDEENSEWGSPMNLGFPYSSPYDDFLYTPSQDGDHVVFASNRGCSSDSVWVYVLKRQDVPVRRDVSGHEELMKLMALDPVGYEERIERSNPIMTEIPENIDTRKYLDKITEVRNLQDTLTVYNERLQKDRNEYALSSDEDDRMELTERILQQEATLPLIQEKLDVAKSQLQKIEMEFLFSGVVIDPDKLLAQADKEVVGEATTYTFEKRSFGSEFELKFVQPIPQEIESTQKEE